MLLLGSCCSISRLGREVWRWGAVVSELVRVSCCMSVVSRWSGTWVEIALVQRFMMVDGVGTKRH